MSESRAALAALWMLGAMVSFTAMSIAGRYTAVELDTFELMMYRSFIGIVLVLVFGGLFGTLKEINVRKFHLHILRNVFHFTGQNLWFFALTLIPLAQLIALEFTTPIWVILLAPLVLGERLTSVKLLVAALGFAGVLIVARPDVANVSVGILAAAGCAIGFAGAMLYTKILTRSASVTCILFWLVALQAIFGTLTAGWDGDIAVPSPGVFNWVMVVAVGGVVAHLSITMALTHAPATIVGPIDFFRLPVMAIVGMVVFSERLDVLVLAGASLIIAANYLNLRSEARRAEPLPDNS